MLGICPRGNHRDDDITIVSMTYIMNSVNIHYRQTCIDWQLYELFVKLFYLYGYSKVVPDQSSCEDTHEHWISTCISWWLCFTSHRHRDVKLIMWAHVWHGARLTQHEMFLLSLYTSCTLCPYSWDCRMFSRCETTYLGTIKRYSVIG